MLLLFTAAVAFYAIFDRICFDWNTIHSTISPMQDKYDVGFQYLAQNTDPGTSTKIDTYRSSHQV